MGHDVVDRTVLRLLKAKGYSLQANAKTREGAQHPDRDAQFQHINQTVAAAIASGQPAISIDSKKRELVGDFKAVGREFEPKGRPVEVRTHDFKDKDLGHAIPFGVYDLASDEGWVNVGIDCQHRRVRGQLDPRLVAAPRQAAIPTRHEPDDHRGLWRRELQPRTAVEDRVTTSRRQDRP